MKATLSQTDLASGLTRVGRVLSSRTQLPVLSNILIEANKGEAVLSATNLEIGIRVRVAGKIDTQGAITIPARALTEFVTSISNQTVQLTSAESKLTIEAGKYRAVFSGIDAAEFPVLPVASDNSQAIDGQIMTQIATQVAYAAAADESRPVLTGVRFENRDRELVVTATDGFRLARKIISSSNSISIPNLILPAKTILEVARMVGESDKSQVKMESVIKNNQVIFSCGEADLISRVLEGNYPDTEKIIPADSPVEAILDRQEFLRSLRAASVFARENNNIVKFEIRSSKFEIKAQAAQAGESEIETEAQTSGEGEIAFNYKFVIDVLGSMVEERIKLQIKDHLSPGVFRPEKDSSLLALVMPVRV